METFEGGEMLTTNEQFITNNTECREGVKKYEISKQESQEHVTYTLVVNCLERTDEGRYMCFVHVPGLEPLDFPIRMARITVQCKCSSARYFMRGSRGGGQGVRSPLKNHKNIGFISNTGPEPLKNHKATKPAFNVGPLSTRHRNVI